MEILNWWGNLRLVSHRRWLDQTLEDLGGVGRYEIDMNIKILSIITSTPIFGTENPFVLINKITKKINNKEYFTDRAFAIYTLSIVVINGVLLFLIFKGMYTLPIFKKESLENIPKLENNETASLIIDNFQI